MASHFNKMQLTTNPTEVKANKIDTIEGNQLMKTK